MCVPIISGRPPILVLSYKNHAIDEFLKDLIKAEGPSISLIRIGGVSKDPTLATFAEQNHKKDVSTKRNRCSQLISKLVSILLSVETLLLSQPINVGLIKTILIGQSLQCVAVVSSAVSLFGFSTYCCLFAGWPLTTIG